MLAFLVSRAILTLIGVLALASLGDTSTKNTNHFLCDIYVRWDSDWYLSIIEGGYRTDEFLAFQSGATNFAFFPFYPLLVITTQYYWELSSISAGLLVSNLSFVAALLLIFEYTQLLNLSHRAGIGAVILICFIPQSFIFSAIYTESTFLLLLTAAMYALRKQYYLAAGLCAAMLSATRANGIFFIIFAGAWLLRQHGFQPLLYPWRYPALLLPITLAPLGLILFWWFCFLSTGDAFAQASTALHGWGWQTDWPWRNLATHLNSTNPDHRFWVISSLTVFFLSFTLLRSKLYEELLLCISIMLLYWTGVLPNSLLRYSIVLFPIFMGVAVMLENRPLSFWLLLSSCSLMNGFLMTAWVHRSPITW